MTLMIAGLVLFLGAHSIRIFADDWRAARIASMGPKAWKGAYTIVSLVGFALVCYGYGLSRQAPVDLFNPPVWTRHLAALITLPAFVLVVAGQLPGTYIKQYLKHPMVLGTKAWALAHLIANGRLADVILFGSILVWAILDFKAARGRDKAQGLAYPAKGIGRDIAAVVIGLVAWAAFAMYFHALLIGVRPFG